MDPTERDLAAVRGWWRRLAVEVPPDVAGLWFGITDLADGGDVRTLYVAGCPTFDPGDASGDWSTDYCWWPADRYGTPADFAALPAQRLSRSWRTRRRWSAA